VGSCEVAAGWGWEGIVGGGTVLVICSVDFGLVSEVQGCDAVSWSLVEVGESGSKDLKESLSEDG
jgi:hypothetical protein